MVNKHLLRYYIAANNDTTEQLAELLSISRSSLSAKINNKRDFTIREAVKIADRYKFNNEQFVDVFCGGDCLEDRRSS